MRQIRHCLSLPTFQFSQIAVLQKFDKKDFFTITTNTKATTTKKTTTTTTMMTTMSATAVLTTTLMTNDTLLLQSLQRINELAGNTVLATRYWLYAGLQKFGLSKKRLNSRNFHSCAKQAKFSKIASFLQKSYQILSISRIFKVLRYKFIILSHLIEIMSKRL